MDKTLETSWRRAWNDSEHFRKESSLWFWGAEVLGAGVVGVALAIVGAWLTPNNATSVESTAYSTIGGLSGVVGGLIFVFGLIFLWNGIRAPYRQRDEARKRIAEFEGLATSRWYFRLGHISFNKMPEVTLDMIAVELMVTNRLEVPASISHFVLETVSKEGLPQWLDPIRQEDQLDWIIPDRSEYVIGEPKSYPRNDLVTPLYFQPKEAKVGHLTFHVAEWDRDTPLLYIRDEEGTEYP